jgi:hypothetical protein
MSFTRLHPLLPVLGLVASLLCGALASAQDTAQACPAWHALGGYHRQTPGCQCRRDDVPARRQRDRRRLRDARCATATMWDTLELGRRNAGADLSIRTRATGGGHQRPGRRAHGSNAGILPRTGHGLSAGVRSPGGRHARHSRRADGDAGGVRQASASPRYSPRPCRWPRAIRSRRCRRTTWSAGANVLSQPGPTRRAFSCRTSRTTSPSAARRAATAARRVPAAGAAGDAAEARRRRS